MILVMFLVVVRGDVGVDSLYVIGFGMDVIVYEYMDVVKGSYGLFVLIEIFRFVTSFIVLDMYGCGLEDVNSLFGLKFVMIMIDVNVEYFRVNYVLLNLVLDDFSRALCGVVTSCSSYVLAVLMFFIMIIYSEF